MLTTRQAIGAAIAERLWTHRDQLAVQWATARPIRYFVQDDLLPADDVRELATHFPDPQTLLLRASLREHKRVGVDVRRYDPRIGEYLYAFQEPAVVQAVSEITQLRGLEPDPTLYASGISVMGRGDFLEPHLDNSHDGDGRRYRVLNLLFYVSPDWRAEYGGNLELWDPRVRTATPVVAQFNRLVVMETHQTNWHSVSRVGVDASRYCVSNYYFSVQSPTGHPYTQVTMFRGRPEEPVKRLLLWADSAARNLAGRLIPNARRRSTHQLPRG